MPKWLADHIVSAALGLASILIFLEIIILPPFFDFLSDICLWGLIALVGWIRQGDKP